MITVEQATQIILENARPSKAEKVDLMYSNGRILREDIVADRDFPPFDRVTMDGIAIDFSSFENGQRSYNIEGIQAAGNPALCLKDKMQCIEVMTGAVLPEGTDTVIRYEDLVIEDGIATIQIEYLGFRQNIHHKGIDRKENDVILRSGHKISPAEIGTLATVGKTEVWVSALPKTAIVSTGDELVDVEEKPLPHQIRRSNVFSLAAILRGQCGIDADLFHLPDDEQEISESLEEILADYELVILSGAVSEGKYDFVPKVLSNLNVEKLFHKVAQRPGKPFWFGRRDDVVIFALPGNPVSAFMCACRYVVPYIDQQLCDSMELTESWACLATDVIFKPDLTYFLPVKVVNTEGVVFATPVEGHGSGDLANLNDADGFLELPSDRSIFKEKEVFPLFLYRP